jgi:hypothetical protein
MFRGPADQRRFWTGRWHEREVDAHVAAGEVAVHADGEIQPRLLMPLRGARPTESLFVFVPIGGRVRELGAPRDVPALQTFVAGEPFVAPEYSTRQPTRRERR